MSNEYRIRELFDNLMFVADDRITVPTAQRLAAELGIEFDPRDFDHA